MKEPKYELLTHQEEYQKALREVLAPTLEYKAKWEELKKRLQDRFQELKQQQCLLMEDRETKDIPNLMLRTENGGMRRMLTEIMQTMNDMEEK